MKLISKKILYDKNNNYFAYKGIIDKVGVDKGEYVIKYMENKIFEIVYQRICFEILIDEIYDRKIMKL